MRSYAFYHCPPPVFNARGDIVWAQSSANESAVKAAADAGACAAGGSAARLRRLPSRSSSLSIHPLHVNSLVTHPRFRPSGRFTIGYAETIGLRPSMEDSVSLHGALDGDLEMDYFAIFDGHNGPDAAEYAAKNLHIILLEKLKNKTKKRDVPELLRSTFKTIHKRIMDNGIPGGTTATVVVFRGRVGHVAHVGDSRAAVFTDGALRRLTHDHRPGDPDEARAVIARGGMVSSGPEPRVNGLLGLTRALGDREVAAVISCEPAVAQVTPFSWSNSSMIIACDGMWDHVSDEEVASVLRAIPSPEAAAMQLRDTAFMNGSQDNITVVVLRPELPPGSISSPASSAPPSPMQGPTKTEPSPPPEADVGRSSTPPKEEHEGGEISAPPDEKKKREEAPGSPKAALERKRLDRRHSGSRSAHGSTHATPSPSGLHKSELLTPAGAASDPEPPPPLQIHAHEVAGALVEAPPPALHNEPKLSTS